jgi:glycosyltransferase involved in cell wall biosynthesis
VSIDDGVDSFAHPASNSRIANLSSGGMGHAADVDDGIACRRAVSSGRPAAQPPCGGSGARVMMVSHEGGFDGGAEFVFHDMVLALREKWPDLDMIAVYPRKGQLAAEAARLGVRTKCALLPWWTFQHSSAIPPLVGQVLFFPGIVKLLPSIAHAVYDLLRQRPTVVLSNTMVIPSYAVAAKMLGIPHYWLVHEFGWDDHRLRFILGYRMTIRLIGRLSASVICCSRAVENALVAVAPMTKTHVVYPAIDDPPGTPPDRHNGEVMRAVLVGRFVQSKGQHLAVEAVGAARDAGVDIQLTLVGAGDRQPVRELARCLGVEDLVTIYGPTRDVGRYWRAAHVALMCSDAEAFGRVTVEAMRAGLPVCGTDAGGTPEIIDPGVNGLLSPAGDADALAANLMALESDEDLRRSLAVRAMETARPFRRDRYGDELAAVMGFC